MRPESRTIPAPVRRAALFQRFASCSEAGCVVKKLLTMGYGLGSYEEGPAGRQGGA
jgi:hypothetical protein